MYKQIELTIKGSAPLLMNSALHSTNPLSPVTKVIKSVTSKRVKTDEDHLLIYKLQWIAALYLTSTIDISLEKNNVSFSCPGVPCITGEVLKATLENAGKKHKLGQLVKTGVICDTAPLIYDGAKDVTELFGDGSTKFVDVRSVKVQRATVMRCRPIFPEWSLKFVVNYLSDVINEHQIIQLAETAGKVVGICDYRPTFGRFDLVS